MTRRHASPVRRGLVFLAAATLALTGLAACGSSSDPLASKTPEEILAASQAAALHATAVHITSTSGHGPTAITLTLQLTQDGGQAHVTILGESFEAIRTANTLYVRGNARFSKHLSRLTHTHITPGSWVKSQASSGPLSQLAVFTRPNGELRLLLTSTGTPTKGTTTTINGQHAIELKQNGKLYTGKLYIATTGPPYPLQNTRTGHTPLQTTFTNWNQPTTVTTPTPTTTINHN